jgi:carbamoylphosphate synthase large subunit
MRVWFNRTFSSVSSALSLIRDADKNDGRYHLIYSTTNDGTPAANAAHQFELEPFNLKGDQYLAWCLDFCRLHRVDIFVPGKEASLISSAHPAFLEIGTRVLSVATTPVLDILHDKARFYETVDLPLAPPPDFRVVENIDQFDAAFAELRALYPTLCIKPSKSVYGLGFSVLDERRSCAQILLDGAQYHIGLDDLRSGLAQQGSFRTMLLMEYLEGHEYSVDCVADHGRLLCAVARQKPMTAGHGQTIVVHTDIQAATAKLTADYALNGVFNVQFRETGGQVRLLEINPRMSGGIGMACVAGPNLPFLTLAAFDRGARSIEIPAIRAGIRVAEYSCAVEVGMN